MSCTFFHFQNKFIKIIVNLLLQAPKRSAPSGGTSSPSKRAKEANNESEEEEGVEEIADEDDE